MEGMAEAGHFMSIRPGLFCAYIPTTTVIYKVFLFSWGGGTYMGMGKDGLDGKWGWGGSLNEYSVMYMRRIFTSSFLDGSDMC